MRKNGQSHLLAELESFSAEEREAFATQVLHLDNMIPRGLSQYLATAREKLKQSAEGFNEYAAYSPDVPTGKTLGLQDLVEF